MYIYIANSCLYDIKCSFIICSILYIYIYIYIYISENVEIRLSGVEPSFVEVGASTITKLEYNQQASASNNE